MIEIALVGDLHGNLPAVEALDGDLRARGIEKIWCLGDVVGKGPCSADTMDWAMARCEVILLGNWDEGIARKQYPKDEFYYAQLGEKRMKRLMELPLEHHAYISGRKVRLFHGRPVMGGAYQVYGDAETLSPYFDPDFDVVGYADVHRQGMRVLAHRGLLFNTGSVGNGLGVPMVQYAILRGNLDSREPGPLDIAMVTLPYDRERTVRDTRAAAEKGLVNADLFQREIETGIYAR